VCSRQGRRRVWSWVDEARARGPQVVARFTSDEFYRRCFSVVASNVTAEAQRVAARPIRSVPGWPCCQLPAVGAVRGRAMAERLQTYGMYKCTRRWPRRTAMLSTAAVSCIYGNQPGSQAARRCADMSESAWRAMLLLLLLLLPPCCRALLRLPRTTAPCISGVSSCLPQSSDGCSERGPRRGSTPPAETLWRVSPPISPCGGVPCNGRGGPDSSTTGRRRERVCGRGTRRRGRTARPAARALSGTGG